MRAGGIREFAKTTSLPAPINTTLRQKADIGWRTALRKNAATFVGRVIAVDLLACAPQL